LLTVEDDEFWLDISPVEFRELLALQDAVTVVGYPIGGTRYLLQVGLFHVLRNLSEFNADRDTISVTNGVVSHFYRPTIK
ncbi:hypothetical protein Tco_1510467, partial [Tanacetum coccineum]